MKAWLFLLAGLFVATASADDWRETLSKPQPGKFPAPRAYQAIYRFGWSGIAAAQADVRVSKVPGGQLGLAVKAQTIGIARTLWRMDAQHTAWCNATTLRPIRIDQTETYADEKETTRATFAADGVRRLTKVEPLEGPQEKEKRFKLANVFDLQSGLLFVRSQRLQAGDVYRLVVYPSTSAYVAEIEVVGRETLKVVAGDFDAIKCEVKFQRVTKKYELAPHKKFKRAFAWLSDDRERLLLKVEAEVFVGSVWSELQSVKFDPKL